MNVDLFMLVVLGILVITGWLVAELADEVQEGTTQRWDNWVLRQFRRSADMTTPVGPAWLQDAYRRRAPAAMRGSFTSSMDPPAINS